MQFGFRPILLLAIFSSIFLLAPQIVLADEQKTAAITKFGIANFDCVSKDIWRGALPSDDSLSQLANNGVRTVIDLRMDGEGSRHEEQTSEKLGLKYVHLPIGFHSPAYLYVNEFLKVVSDPENLPVFIHCRQGADRTGTLIGIYRILVGNWSFNSTYSEMRLHHFKPWLFNMKRSVAAVSKNQTVRQLLQTTIDNAKVTVIDSSETMALVHSG